MTSLVNIKRAAATVAASLVLGVLAFGTTAPAQADTLLASRPYASTDADCTTNTYRVVWRYAGVYDGMTQNSYEILTKESGDRVTGPSGWAHVSANGYRWTKVWVYSVPGWREGWIRNDAVTYVGCS